MNRRDFLSVASLGALSCHSGTTTSVGRSESSSLPNLRDPLPPPPCERVAHQTAGPFYVEDRITRSAIAEDQPGRRLHLAFTVVDAETCRPRNGTVISLFHANAEGLYSGFAEQGSQRDQDTAGQTWLRGAQQTGEDGRVDFDTIYPGWYPSRVTHLHFTAWENDKLVLTSQIYFPDDVMREVYRHAPYRGWRDTEDDNDEVRKRPVKGVLPRLVIERRARSDLGTLTIPVRS